MDDNKKFWERTARLYGPIQERSNAPLYEAVAEHCRPYLTGDTRVLELACGSGQLTIPLCACAGYWEATDFAPAMVRETGRRCPGVCTSVQDATALTCGDGSFDVVLIANALHIMPEPERAMEEIRRVLSPGGILLAPTFVYEGEGNRLRMKLMELVGFRTFVRWNLNGLAGFLEANGFEILEKCLLPGSPLPEGFAAGRKK